MSFIYIRLRLTRPLKGNGSTRQPFFQGEAVHGY